MVLTTFDTSLGWTNCLCCFAQPFGVLLRIRLVRRERTVGRLREDADGLSERLQNLDRVGFARWHVIAGTVVEFVLNSAGGHSDMPHDDPDRLVDGFADVLELVSSETKELRDLDPRIVTHRKDDTARTSSACSVATIEVNYTVRFYDHAMPPP